MLELIIFWICAYALAELVEPADTSAVLHEQKRDVSGFLQFTLIGFAIVVIVWKALALIWRVAGW
jgi:hypothetical protein